MGRTARFPLGERGRGRLLFTYIVLLGAAVAALFANDGAALIPDTDRYCHAAGIRVQQRHDAGIRYGRRVYCRYGQPAADCVEPSVNIVSADFFGTGVH